MRRRIALAGFVLAFACLARALAAIPLGVAYAIRAGVGIASLTLIGWVLYRQALSPLQLAGVGAILGGVVVLVRTK